MVSIDSDRCIGCGVCEAVCPMNLFQVSKGKASLASTSDCISCGNCLSCPAGCISLGEAVEIWSDESD